MGSVRSWHVQGWAQGHAPARDPRRCRTRAPLRGTTWRSPRRRFSVVRTRRAASRERSGCASCFRTSGRASSSSGKSSRRVRTSCPPTVIAELKKLQDDVPAVPFAEIKEVVETSLGAPLGERLRQLRREAARDGVDRPGPPRRPRDARRERRRRREGAAAGRGRHGRRATSSSSTSWPPRSSARSPRRASTRRSGSCSSSTARSRASSTS